MRSDPLTAALDALEGAVDALAAVSVDGPSHAELLTVLERVERVRRRLPTVEHSVIARLSAEASPLALGGKNLASVLGFGCGCRVGRRGGGSMRPLTWGRAGRWAETCWSRGCPPPPRRRRVGR